MKDRHASIRRRVAGGLLGGMVLVALSGCYPYYYDIRYSHNDGYYGRDYHGSRHHYDHRYHHRDRDDRHWRRRHYRGY